MCKIQIIIQFLFLKIICIQINTKPWIFFTEEFYVTSYMKMYSMCPLMIFFLLLLRSFRQFFFQVFPLVSCCIVLNSFPVDHKVISYSGFLSALILSVYFFVLPQSLLLLSNSFHRPYHCFINFFFQQILLFKVKWFSIALCCCLQRSFLLQQIMYLLCSHSLSLHWTLLVM